MIRCRLAHFRTYLRFALCLLLVVLYGCDSPQDCPYGKYVDHIVSEVAKEMKRDYGLICVGSGGSMPTNVRSIDMSFHVYRRGTLEEARELMVQAKTRLVEKVNAHEKIRPYLKNYPFKLEDAGILLSFRKKNGSRYLDDSVALVCSARDNKIVYDKVELQILKSPGFVDVNGTHTPGEWEEDEVFVTILEEPFDETMRIVQKGSKAEKNQIKK